MSAIIKEIENAQLRENMPEFGPGDNVTVRILKDILQTDDQMFVYNYLLNADPEMPSSIVTPSVLIEEMELKKNEEKIMKPPLLPSPLAGK